MQGREGGLLDGRQRAAVICLAAAPRLLHNRFGETSEQSCASAETWFKSVDRRRDGKRRSGKGLENEEAGKGRVFFFLLLRLLSYLGFRCGSGCPKVVVVLATERQ